MEENGRDVRYTDRQRKSRGGVTKTESQRKREGKKMGGRGSVVRGEGVRGQYRGKKSKREKRAAEVSKSDTNSIHGTVPSGKREQE